MRRCHAIRLCLAIGRCGSAGTRLIPAFLILASSLLSARAAEPAPLTSLPVIHALSNDQASRALPVAFEATVTYFRAYEKTLFVQDGDIAIYVQPATADLTLAPGDRVLIKGATRPSFRPFVMASEVKFLHHGSLPGATRASFDDLLTSRLDCRYVTVRGSVRAADLELSARAPIYATVLQLVTDGGYVNVTLDNDSPEALRNLLDAEIEVSGAASGEFDGKMQETGVLLHVNSLAGVKILRRAEADPWAIPVTPMDEVLMSYHVNDLTRRVRVRGTITYYQPGSAAVLQQGSRSIWITTRTYTPLRIGDLADVTGIPAVLNGFLALTHGEIRDTQLRDPVSPVQATWSDLASSRNIFDLVSVEAKVVADVREASQDEYVLDADGRLFSAIYRHPDPASRLPLLPMRRIPVGSRVRVTGICLLEDANPFRGAVPFHLLLRSFDDLVVVANPSMLNVRNLLVIVGLLLLVLLGVGVRSSALDRKVRRQTAAMAARVAAEAALERQRSKILEDINGARPLAEIIEEITELVSTKLDDAPCWCQINSGPLLGKCPQSTRSLRIATAEIPARSGPPLGTILVGFATDLCPGEAETEALTLGTRLATLAIETHRIYSDLKHRSEFDVLTEIHNRFSLERYMDAQIEEARDKAAIFGLIYIDLDDFKHVNDHYGHRTGDLYLREVARRMKRQLRSHDMLARLGGDEFAVLLPMVRNRAEVQEVAERLHSIFAEACTIDAYILHGSASLGIALYPEDGTTRDTLLSAADAAMYVEKQSRSLSVPPDPISSGVAWLLKD